MIEALEQRQLLSVTNLVEGVTSTEAGATDMPADPTGAVGPNNLVNAVNSEIQWFTKAGSLQMAEQLNAFFAPLGTNATTSISDPHVIYDQYSGRFVIVAMSFLDSSVPGDLVNDSHVYMAVSIDSNPNDGWHFQDIHTKLTINGTDAGLDNPAIAVSQDAVYLTGSMFQFSGTSSAVSPVITPVGAEAGYLGSRLWIIPKTPLYGGGQSFLSGPFDPLSATGFSLTTSGGVFNLDGAEHLQPAQMYGTTPTGLGTYLTFDGGIDPNTGHNLLGVIEVDNPLGTPVFTRKMIDVGTTSSKNFKGAPQPWDATFGLFEPVQNSISGGETYVKIEVDDERVQSAVWRNGFLYAANEVIPYSGRDVDQTTVHWYQISTGSATVASTPALFDQGDVGGEDIGVGVNTYFPAIAVNARGDMAIGFSASGPGSILNDQDTTPDGPVIYAGAYVTGRLVGDPRGQTRGPQALAVGLGLFDNITPVVGGGFNFVQDTISAWGEYSAVQVDPSDDTTFWAYNMYALAPTVNGDPLFPTSSNWGTRWGHFTAELVDLPALGNFVWDDLNGNGIQDIGEPGLQGVIFRLYDSSNNLVDQTVSDSSGHWYLQSAPTGSVTPGSGYKIVADISALDPITQESIFDGYTYSPYKQGNDDRVDSDFVQSTTDPFQAVTTQPTSADITLAAGTLYEDFDLGLFKPFVAISPLTQTVPEGGPGAVHQAAFTVTLYTGVLPSTGTRTTVTSPWATSVYYSTVPVSATSDVDFQSHTADLVTIPAGQTSNTTDLRVAVYGDSLPEGDETFKVELLEPSEVFGSINENLPPGIDPTELPLPDSSVILNTTEFPDKFATVVIKDDDLAVLSVDRGPTVFEGSTSNVTYAIFTIRLSVPNPLQIPVTVNYVLNNGTATGGASASIPGADFNNTAGSVVFAPGQLTKTVRVAVYGDDVKEGNENFSLVVTPADSSQLTPGTLAQRTSTATIIDLGVKKITFSAQKSATYTDIAGNIVTITLSGPGKGFVTLTTSGLGRMLVLNGSTEKSVLTIRTNRGQAMFGGIQINGGLAALNGATTNLSGSLVSMDAIRSLTLNYLTGGQIVLGPSTKAGVFITLNLNRVVDSSLTTETSIKTFNLGSWIDTGAEDFLLAPAIKMIHATGDFDASIETSSGDLGTLTVNGLLKGSTIVVSRNNGHNGIIGTITAGSIINSHIEAGAKLTSLTARTLFSNSTIVAPRIGTLELGEIRNTTSSVLIAAEAGSIGSVEWTYKKKTQKIRNVDNPGPRGLDKDLDKNPQIILEIT
ncbi:MAG TPA: Calx-beta domain-containing protein [Tepidisphaeraceae bacterium]|jgi:hypothetical protein|nr:Calx-beta domain-containing protein [Tepidisphaeraceae bacterium]